MSLLYRYGTCKENPYDYYSTHVCVPVLFNFKTWSSNVKNKHFSTNFKKNLNKMPQIIVYSESRVAYNRDAGICILFD